MKSKRPKRCRNYSRDARDQVEGHFPMCTNKDVRLTPRIDLLFMVASLTLRVIFSPFFPFLPIQRASREHGKFA
jgi:hypothetical protein